MPATDREDLRSWHRHVKNLAVPTAPTRAVRRSAVQSDRCEQEGDAPQPQVFLALDVINLLRGFEASRSLAGPPKRKQEQGHGEHDDPPALWSKDG